MELDLKNLFATLLSHIKAIIASVIFGAVIFFIISSYVLTPIYSSSGLLYVSNRTDNSPFVSNSDVAVSRALLNTCSVVLKSNSVLTRISAESNLGLTPNQIKGMVSDRSVSSTEVFSISVSHPDPQIAKTVAETITKIFPEELKKIIPACTISVIDTPNLPKSPSSPNVFKNTIIGGLLAFLISSLLILFLETLDTRVRDEITLEKEFDLPIIGLIPSFSLVDIPKMSQAKIKKEDIK